MKCSLVDQVFEIKIQFFPNNEIRLRLGAIKSPSPDKKGEKDGESASPPLDISADIESISPSEKKVGFGKTPPRTEFGLHGKRMLLRAGGALDRFDSVSENGIFLTGTLPGSTPESMQAIADWSGYLVHRLKAWINHFSPSKLDFYVWERQARGALHLHYFAHIPDTAVRSRIISCFKAEWIRLLEKVFELSGVDVFARSYGGTWRNNHSAIQAYAQPVKKSVAAYLSKYCSKNAGKSTQKSTYYPSRWYGVSRPLHQLIFSYSRKLEACFSRFKNAFRRYEDLCSILGNLSIKSYEYADKFGHGKNSIFYIAQTDLYSIHDLIQRSENFMVPKITDSVSTEIAKMIATASTYKCWQNYWSNLSPSNRRLISSNPTLEGLNNMELYAIAVDFYLLSEHLIGHSLWDQKFHSRVNIRMNKACVALETAIDLEKNSLKMDCLS